MKLREKVKRRGEIPTASMGDVAFLILIFFLTSTVFTKDKGLKMLLPEKSEDEAPTEIVKENIVTISINPAGEANVKTVGYNEFLRPEEYNRIIEIVEERLKQRDTLLVVSIRASKEAQYRNMVDALDQVKLAKITTDDGREVRANKISLIPTSEEE
jgi:biopolymer transport protein ExbD